MFGWVGWSRVCRGVVGQLKPQRGAVEGQAVAGGRTDGRGGAGAPGQIPGTLVLIGLGAGAGLEPAAGDVPVAVVGSPLPSLLAPAPHGLTRRRSALVRTSSAAPARHSSGSHWCLRPDRLVRQAVEACSDVFCLCPRFLSGGRSVLMVRSGVGETPPLRSVHVRGYLFLEVVARQTQTQYWRVHSDRGG